ncbi:electron transport complex subunit RsxC, partial [Proteus vulgaris]
QTSQATPTVEAPAESAETEEVDPRKAAVAAALARVKAKKAQQTSQATPTVEAPAESAETEEVDPRKAAVAAAIARVKAKKEAEQRRAKEEVTLD